MAKFAEVIIKVPLGTKSEFTYAIKKEDEPLISVGKRVEVNLRGKKIVALVVKLTDETPSYATKEIIRVLDDTPIFTEELFELSKWVSGYYLSSLSEVIYSIISFKNAKLPRVYKTESEPLLAPSVLTEEQQNAIATIRASSKDTFYVWGITGSGKTEVYLEIAKDVINQGKSVIYLLPEIGLTHQLIQYIKGKFPNHKVAVLHSLLTESERLGEWQKIINGEIDIVVGARSAIFAPLPNLGLIIMDEEHDASYKSDSFVCYHTRTVATKRAKMNNARFILGSATPSLESYKAFTEGNIDVIRLNKRAVNGSTKSEIEVIAVQKSNTIISNALKNELQKTIDEGKQAILFLNKRGYLHRLVCPECGYVATCPHCSIPLTYHKEYNKLVCHECGRAYPIRTTCEKCGAETVIFKSFGTELVEQEVKAFLPFARVLRLDRDVTAKGKKTFEVLAKDFRDGKADILIGTQMVAKGLNFPNVNLVGVINALSGYTMNDFRADERLFALLVQVAGRGGRFLDKSKVIVQTADPFSPPIVAVKNDDIDKFLKDSLEMRKQLKLPPFTHFARIIIRSKYEDRASKINSIIMKNIFNIQTSLVNKRKVSEDKRIALITSGACPIQKLQDDYRYHTVVSSKSISLIDYVIKEAVNGFEKTSGVRIKIDIDPMDLL